MWRVLKYKANSRKAAVLFSTLGSVWPRHEVSIESPPTSRGALVRHSQREGPDKPVQYGFAITIPRAVMGPLAWLILRRGFGEVLKLPVAGIGGVFSREPPEDHTPTSESLVQEAERWLEEGNMLGHTPDERGQIPPWSSDWDDAVYERSIYTNVLGLTRDEIRFRVVWGRVFNQNEITTAILRALERQSE